MGARVNLYEELYDDLIADRGIDCLWERAAVCHCVTKDSGQPKFLCPVCGGSGYKYLKPKQIRVAITMLTADPKLGTLELREPGTAYITPKEDVIMGYRDRLYFPDFQCVFSEVLHFDFSEDGYGISQRTYRKVKSVVLLSDDTYAYEQDIDFEITDDGYHLRWKNSELIKKIDGKNLSILYYTTPSYLVVDLLHELRGTLSDRNSSAGETFRELPKQYKLQREDFIYKIADPEPVNSNSTETGNSAVDDSASSSGDSGEGIEV